MRKMKASIALGTLVCLIAALAILLTGSLDAQVQSNTSRVLLAMFMMGAVCSFFLLGRAPVPDKVRDGGKGFGVRETNETGVTFMDVAANEEARASLMELADYSKNPEKYERMGARMPRGVLLYGPPGTGKTLLARALAGEAGVPFFALSGSDFVQMYAGVGASRVRELFDKARKAGRCVIFIDEIDAMGKKRDESASDEREQTLNALLSEMSGFKPCPGTLVLAATNRLDTLDPALTRPGRFDRHIEVGLPGRSERLSILKLHTRNKPMDEAIDLSALAAQTVSFSGASLESMVNEAAIRAAGRGATRIGREDVEKAYIRQVAGDDKKSFASRAERSIIALHEAGHALATRLLLPDNILSRVSILPTGKGAGGYSLSIPPERALTNRVSMERQIQVLLAGRAAELLVGGEEELTSGAVNDLQRASELASVMVLDLGMAGDVCVSMRQLQKSMGAQTGEAAQLARDLLRRQYEAVTTLLSEHVAQLMNLAEALLEREALSGEELEQLLSA